MISGTRSSILSILFGITVVGSCAVNAAARAEEKAGFDPRSHEIIQFALNYLTVDLSTRWSSGTGLTAGSRKRSRMIDVVFSEIQTEMEPQGERILANLRSGDFRILNPLEKGDSLSDLKLYRELQKKCARLPTGTTAEKREDDAEPKFVEVPVFLDYSEDLSTRRDARFDSFRILAGTQRPIDYEYLFKDRNAFLARQGFALYRLRHPQGREIYLLRAENYLTAHQLESRGLKRPARLPGFFTAFSMPDCSYLGSLVLGHESRIAVELLRGRKSGVTEPPFSASIAEVVHIDGQILPLSLTAYIKRQDRVPNQLRLLVWDIFNATSPDGYLHNYRECPDGDCSEQRRSRPTSPFRLPKPSQPDSEPQEPN